MAFAYFQKAVSRSALLESWKHLTGFPAQKPGCEINTVKNVELGWDGDHMCLRLVCPSHAAAYSITFQPANRVHGIGGCRLQRGLEGGQTHSHHSEGRQDLGTRLPINRQYESLPRFGESYTTDTGQRSPLQILRLNVATTMWMMRMLGVPRASFVIGALRVP